MTFLTSCASVAGGIEPQLRQSKASWYSEGRHVACEGARFNPDAMTVAHRSLPCRTRLRVCRKGFGCVRVVVNDRGPAKWTGRELDLSRGAARALGMIEVGVAVVQWSIE